MSQEIAAGAAIRRLRKKEGLTQQDFAARLGISASYLNLLERNRRRLSARVAMQLVGEFGFDPKSLSADDAIGGVTGLQRRLADARFADLGLDREDIDDFLTNTPQLAAAFARAYDNASPSPGTAKAETPGALGEVRAEIDRWRNHFGDLDEAGESLADEIRLSRGELSQALVERLRERHQLSVRVLPQDILPQTLRRVDLHARQVQISEMLSPQARTFQLAQQVVELEFRQDVRRYVEGANLTTDLERALFTRHLNAYTAAAIVMPYRRFLRACETTGYTFPVLMRRFGVSFEQLAHRLTTLQRVGERGLPFFMARIDRAGQFSKRYIGASKAEFLGAPQTCPLWNAHTAFAARGDWVPQLIDMEGSNPDRWLTIARAVEHQAADGAAQFVIILGLDAKLATAIDPWHGQTLSPETAMPVGPGCRSCYRANCLQRAVPPPDWNAEVVTSGRQSTPFTI